MKGTNEMSSNSASLTAPNTFEGFERLFERKRSNWTGKVGNNTYAVRLRVHGAEDPLDAFALQYHHTDVVRLYRDGSYAFDTGGWPTMTTADRMSESCPPGWYVGRHRGEILLSQYGWNSNPVRFLPDRRWRMIPDPKAVGGFRVEGGGLERLTDVVLRRIAGNVVAIEPTPGKPGEFRDVFTKATMDPAAGKGARRSSPDAARVLEDVSQAGIRAVVRRSF